MRRLLAVFAVLAWSVLLRGEACGTEIGDKQRGEPCTRSSECAEGLSCRGGICDVTSDAGEDGGG
jgi:hypothetical protein